MATATPDFKPINVACLGMGWWSDVLADAIKKSRKINIVSCYTRSQDKREDRKSTRLNSSH